MTYEPRTPRKAIIAFCFVVSSFTSITFQLVDYSVLIIVAIVSDGPNREDNFRTVIVSAITAFCFIPSQISKFLALKFFLLWL